MRRCAMPRSRRCQVKSVPNSLPWSVWTRWMAIGSRWRTSSRKAEVDSANGGRAALERLAQQAYDLVVCDLSMPDLDGPAVYRAIEPPPPPRPAVMFVTGHADAGPYEEFIRTTQVPVVGKPCPATRHAAPRWRSGDLRRPV